VTLYTPLGSEWFKERGISPTELHWVLRTNNRTLPGHLLAELTSVISCILREFETKPKGRMRSASPSKKSKQGRSCNTGTEDLMLEPEMVTQVLRHLPPTINDVVTQNTTKIRYTLTISVLSSPPAPFSSFLLYLYLYRVCIPTGQFLLQLSAPTIISVISNTKANNGTPAIPSVLVFMFICSWLYYFCFLSGFLWTEIFLSVGYTVRRQ